NSIFYPTFCITALPKTSIYTEEEAVHSIETEGIEIPRFSEMKLWFRDTIGVIGSAAKIPFRNPSFITFVLITSFPLFCMTLVPRLPSSQPPLIMEEAAIQLRVLTHHPKGHMIQLLRVYLFELVSFFTALTTIYAASTVYISSDRWKVSLRDLLRNSITKTRWREPMLTFLTVSLLSHICLSSVYYWHHHAKPLLSSSCSNRLLQAINMVVPVVAFDKWVEYGAWWNLSVVVSILEKDNRGFEAFSDAAELSEGNTRRGFVLMLLYCVWSSRFPTLIAKFTFPSVIAYDVLDTSFLCLGKVMNWVVLTVYYYDCKNRHKGLP
ncbi:uncharacterized protein LOC126607333, partial [Malus sylvestris]|uniref:uncharacterized protein LOC126607333 n=1 Tax=Malus sylvestris TaxID=3752 RepID=UPI0021AC80A4